MIRIAIERDDRGETFFELEVDNKELEAKLNSFLDSMDWDGNVYVMTDKKSVVSTEDVIIL